MKIFIFFVCSFFLLFNLSLEKILVIKEKQKKEFERKLSNQLKGIYSTKLFSTDRIQKSRNKMNSRNFTILLDDRINQKVSKYLNRSKGRHLDENKHLDQNTETTIQTSTNTISYQQQHSLEDMI